MVVGPVARSPLGTDRENQADLQPGNWPCVVLDVAASPSADRSRWGGAVGGTRTRRYPHDRTTRSEARKAADWMPMIEIRRPPVTGSVDAKQKSMQTRRDNSTRATEEREPPEGRPDSRETDPPQQRETPQRQDKPGREARQRVTPAPGNDHSERP